jgi:hypothetical protein
MERKKQKSTARSLVVRHLNKTLNETDATVVTAIR